MFLRKHNDAFCLFDRMAFYILVLWVSLACHSCFSISSSFQLIYKLFSSVKLMHIRFPKLQSISSLPSPSLSSSSSSSQTLSAPQFELSKDMFLLWSRRVLLSPSMLAIYTGVTIGLIKPLQDALFNDFTILRPFGSAIVTLGTPVVALNCLIMSASLAHVNLSPLKISIDNFFRRYIFRPNFEVVVLSDTPVFSPLSKDGENNELEELAEQKVEEKAVIVVVVDRDSMLNASILSPLHSETSVIVDLTSKKRSTSSESLIRKKKQQLVDEEQQHQLPKWRSIAAHTLCRLVIPPLIVLPILQLFVRTGIIAASDKLIQLVICIQAGAPR